MLVDCGPFHAESYVSDAFSREKGGCFDAALDRIKAVGRESSHARL
jgi:hypothetical protein